MKLKIVFLVGFVAILVLLLGIIPNFTTNPMHEKPKPIFQVTLAEPKMYEGGIYAEIFEAEKGEYIFHFVPNGDSPEKLTINVYGEKLNFFENFKLKGTLHQTGISEYYTWEYEGQNLISVSEKQDLKITINPNGNVKGPVSVQIIEK